MGRQVPVRVKVCFFFQFLFCRELFPVLLGVFVETIFGGAISVEAHACCKLYVNLSIFVSDFGVTKQFRCVFHEGTCSGFWLKGGSVVGRSVCSPIFAPRTALKEGKTIGRNLIYSNRANVGVRKSLKCRHSPEWPQ